MGAGAISDEVADVLSLRADVVVLMRAAVSANQDVARASRGGKDLSENQKCGCKLTACHTYASPARWCTLTHPPPHDHGVLADLRGGAVCNEVANVLAVRAGVIVSYIGICVLISCWGLHGHLGGSSRLLRSRIPEGGRHTHHYRVSVLQPAVVNRQCFGQQPSNSTWRYIPQADLRLAAGLIQHAGRWALSHEVADILAASACVVI